MPYAYNREVTVAPHSGRRIWGRPLEERRLAVPQFLMPRGVGVRAAMATLHEIVGSVRSMGLRQPKALALLTAKAEQAGFRVRSRRVYATYHVPAFCGY